MKNVRSETEALRRQAEEKAASIQLQDPAALSPEQIRQTLHELHVHQIELEIQNEELRRSQAELEDSRRRYFDLYDLAPVGYCTLSEAGLILEANLTAASLLGMNRGALVRQPITRFILPPDQDIYYRHRKQLFETGEPQACHLRMTKNDGTFFWAHLSASAAPAADGTPWCRIVVSDISEQKRQMEAREMTARLLLLIQTPGDFRERMSGLTAALQEWSGCEAVGIRLRAGDDYPYYETRGFPPAFVEAESRLCASGPDGDILRDSAGNPVLECMCGNVLCGRFDPDQPFFTAQGSFWSNNTTALLARTTEVDRQARTRNRCNGEGYQSVALIPLRADGQAFGLLQFNDRRPDRFTPDLIAHFEALAASLAIALSRRQAVETLHQSEAKYRTLFENAGDAIFIHDAQERMLAVNPTACERLGYRHAELMSMTIGQVVAPEDAVHAPEQIARLMAQDRLTFETVHRCRDGSLIPTEVNARRIVWDGRPAMMSICRDIGERKRGEAQKAKLETQLQQAIKMESVGRLAGGVAHDYNNMLSVIIGYAELAMDKVGPADPLRADLAEILAAARRSTQITGQLLAFARKQAIAPKVLDPNATVEGMLTMLRRLIGEEIEMAWRPGAGLWPVKMDPSQIDQILANLCVNARDAIAGVGRIVIRTENVRLDPDDSAFPPDAVAGQFVLLSVSDDGCGMDREALDSLFEPFFTTKEVGQGTGLGLATVYGIVKQNDGFINAESAPGKGTTFKIYLPRYSGRVTAAREEDPQPIALGRGETVLVVEDEVSILKLTRRMLTVLGYTVLGANSPGEAMGLAGEHAGRIDLLITDVVMPEMNGRDLADRLHTLCPGLKALFMSGYTADVIAHRGVLDQGFQFIQKPFSKIELAAKVRAALDRP